jgi:hypothetical protein
MCERATQEDLIRAEEARRKMKSEENGRTVAAIQRDLLDRYRLLLDISLKDRSIPNDQIAECATACRISGIDQASMDRELFSRFP